MRVSSRTIHEGPRRVLASFVTDDSRGTEAGAREFRHGRFTRDPGGGSRASSRTVHEGPGRWVLAGFVTDDSRGTEAGAREFRHGRFMRGHDQDSRPAAVHV